MLAFSVAAFSLFTTAYCFSVSNVNATFQDSPSPFELRVNPDFINDVHSRVQHARAPMAVDGATDGPSLANFMVIQDYWVSNYNWNHTQASINRNLKQFTTIVQPAASSYGSAIPLHFVHHKSNHTDAMPLLFIHGWPGSFLEVSKIIGSLTNPPNASVPAFHVVAPSVPGFGFSPASQYAGFGPIEAAHTFNALMLQLGYSKYVIQAGDLGGIILRYQANLYPENVVSVLSNFWIIQPSDNDLLRLAQNQTTADETAYINNIEKYMLQLSGYRYIQSLVPLEPAYALTDSPLGYAMWIYTLMAEAIDPSDFQWTLEEIITWSLMHTIQGPYGGIRFYKEMQREGVFAGFGFGALPFVSQPVAISEFPYRLPLDWARREGNVRVRNVHKRGGHFAAYEVPDLLLGDIRNWFGDGNVAFRSNETDVGAA